MPARFRSSPPPRHPHAHGLVLDPDHRNTRHAPRLPIHLRPDQEANHPHGHPALTGGPQSLVQTVSTHLSAGGDLCSVSGLQAQATSVSVSIDLPSRARWGRPARHLPDGPATVGNRSPAPWKIGASGRGSQTTALRRNVCGKPQRKRRRLRPIIHVVSRDGAPTLRNRVQKPLCSPFLWTTLWIQSPGCAPGPSNMTLWLDWSGSDQRAFPPQFSEIRNIRNY